ncbi:MAG: lysophospholipid acyltransferase family protein [Paludibacter sp.]|nr:lysophospholipid acyltransferase family protein [Paludibacter sp.]
MSNFSKILLKLAGWTTITTKGEPPKSVICVAPHTSNWDYILGQLFYWSEGRKAKFLIKKTWFKFPFGAIFRALGGIPVDRSSKSSIVEQMVTEFEKHEIFHLAITPEGTRKLVKKWKMGFYHIAATANVPIELAYFDYRKKELGITEILIPTGDEKKDMEKIYKYFENRTARFPENFYLPKQ